MSDALKWLVYRCEDCKKLQWFDIEMMNSRYSSICFPCLLLFDMKLRDNMAREMAEWDRAMSEDNEKPELGAHYDFREVEGKTIDIDVSDMLPKGSTVIYSKWDYSTTPPSVKVYYELPTDGEAHVKWSIASDETHDKD